MSDGEVIGGEGWTCGQDWSGGEDWSRAGWRAHLPGVDDSGALVRRLGGQTIPALAAVSARRAGAGSRS